MSLEDELLSYAQEPDKLYRVQALDLRTNLLELLILHFILDLIHRKQLLAQFSKNVSLYSGPTMDKHLLRSLLAQVILTLK